MIAHLVLLVILYSSSVSMMRCDEGVRCLYDALPFACILNLRLMLVIVYLLPSKDSNRITTGSVFAHDSSHDSLCSCLLFVGCQAQRFL